MIIEQSRGLNRYYVLKSTNNTAADYNVTINTGNHIYNLTHYVIPSVPESARVHQQVNKRSIDEDIKEFFAMKNLAHFTFENESFA